QFKQHSIIICHTVCDDIFVYVSINSIDLAQDLRKIYMRIDDSKSQLQVLLLAPNISVLFEEGKLFLSSISR
ncbi:hypothetical protein ACJX0J_029097, partial [Zea mays]